MREEISPAANLIFGSTFDPEAGDNLRVSLIVTGLNKADNSYSHLADAPPLEDDHGTAPGDDVADAAADAPTDAAEAGGADTVGTVTGAEKRVCVCVCM